MGLKRGNGKRRGINAGVEKHRIRSKMSTTELKSKGHGGGICGIRATQISTLGEGSFTLIQCLCCFLRMLPMEYSSRGQLVMTGDWKRLGILYGMIAVLVASAVYKTITIPLLAQNGLTVETILCLFMLLAYLVGGTAVALNNWKAEETLQLVNSWRYTIACLQGATERQVVSPFESLSVSMRVIVSSSAVPATTLGLSLVVLVFPALPTSMHNAALLRPLLMYFGEDWSFLFRLACLPFESLLLLLLTLHIAFLANTFIVGIGTMRIYFDSIRSTLLLI